jgi:sugar phosphate isomerase/epimerase
MIMKISVASYAFFGLLEEGKIDLFGYLESCKYRYHLQSADVWNGMLQNIDDASLKKAKEGLEDRGLELANLCVDGPHIWEDDPEARERNYQSALAHLHVAEVLGARTIRIDAGGRGDTFTNEQFDLTIKRYKEYAQIAYDSGFKVGPENHWGPEKAWANLQKLYHAVDHPAFGISCHISGWHGTQAENDEADRIVAPWVCHIHFAGNITGVPLEEKMNNLRNAGYQGSYSVEHYGKNEYAEVAIQLNRIRVVFDHWRTELKIGSHMANAW